MFISQGYHGYHVHQEKRLNSETENSTMSMQSIKNFTFINKLKQILNHKKRALQST